MPVLARLISKITLDQPTDGTQTMERLLSLAEALDRPVRVAGKIAGWLSLPLIAIIMFDVITRKIDFIRIGMAEMNLRWLNPIIFQDLEWHIHGVIMFLAFGFAYLMNAHVRVDIFREMLSHRKQAWIELMGLLIFALPYMALITYFAYQFVALSVHQGEGSESLTGIGMRYIIKSFMLIGFALLWMAFAATFLRLIAYLFGSASTQLAAENALNIFAESEELEQHRRELEAASAAQVRREEAS